VALRRRGSGGLAMRWRLGEVPFESNAGVHFNVPIDFSISHFLLNHLKAIFDRLT
jgi:hypothetical protein